MTQPPLTYGPTAKTLHWTVAFLIFALLIVGPIMADAPLPPAWRGLLFTAHKTAGVFVLLLTLFRLYWRHRVPPPPLPVQTMPRWQVRAAVSVHIGLYILAVLVPLAGWSLSTAAGKGVVLFGLVPFPAFPFAGAFPGSVSFFAEAHENLASLIAVLIVVHIGAAFMHHFVERDDVLLRMSPQAMGPFLGRLRGA